MNDRWTWRAAPRVLIILLVLLACLIAAGPAAAAKPAPPPGSTQWVYAIYMNADNSLEKYWGQYSLPWLEKIPASTGLKVVAMEDFKSTSGTTLAEITPGKQTVVATYPEKDFGDGATFQWFIQTVHSLYPSTHLAVSVWDHGYGWRYFSQDDTSNDSISMPEFQAAVKNAAVPIDILAFDACNMADVDVAYEAALAGNVNIMVASEETVPGNGYPYDLMLTPVASNPAETPAQVATDMVNGWGKYYDTQKWASTVQLGAIDITKIRAAAADLQNWAGLMNADLPTYKTRYAAELKATWAAFATKHYDLADYCKQLVADTGVADATLKAAAGKVVTDVTGAVIANHNAKGTLAATGLQIWWGFGSDWTTYQAAYKVQPAFAQASPTGMNWWVFLNAYNN